MKSTETPEKKRVTIGVELTLDTDDPKLAYSQVLTLLTKHADIVYWFATTNEWYVGEDRLPIVEICDIRPEVLKEQKFA